MFRRTDPQATLGSLNVLLSPEKMARLEKNHWAGSFRHKALPVLLTNEETFRPLFCEDNGRPNKLVAATLGGIILEEMFDLTDEAALDNFEFNNAWQYALVTRTVKFKFMALNIRRWTKPARKARNQAA